jgi:hypothetical protein
MAPERSLREAASRKPRIRAWLSHEYVWVADVIPPIMISNVRNGRRAVPSTPLAGATGPLTRPPARRGGPAIWSRKRGPKPKSGPLDCRSDAGTWSEATAFGPRVVCGHFRAKAAPAVGC